MVRAIVYVGANSDFIDQSGAVVADRIARSLRSTIEPIGALRYRISVKTDAHVFGCGIGIDIASIEIAKGAGWETVIDILEVKYLPHFIQRFAALPACARVLKALLVLLRSSCKMFHMRWAARRGKVDTHANPCGTLDLLQAWYMNLAAIVAISSLIYWFVIGLAAVLTLAFAVPEIVVSPAAIFGAETDLFKFTEKLGGGLHVIVLTAILLFIIAAFREMFIAPLAQWALEIFSMMEYQIDDDHFLATPNAILDTIDLASDLGYTEIDLLSFSLGAVLATDTFFPRKQRSVVPSPNRQIGHWITLGLPYDMISWSNPAYFSHRVRSSIEVRSWMNIVVSDDFIGTDFTQGGKRGIRMENCQDVRSPDINPPPFKIKRVRVRSKLLDLIPLRRAINHRIYWDDEDARAMNCFSTVVGPAGWAALIYDSLRPAPTRRCEKFPLFNRKRRRSSPPSSPA